MKKAHEFEVVNPSERQDTSSGRGGQRWHAVQNMVYRRLKQCMGYLFEHVDDALFDLAEKAQNNATQLLYFDDMREVRKRRPLIERAFLAYMWRALNNFASLARPASISMGTSAPATAYGSVKLLVGADNELEESLAITSMVGKNESRLARELIAVNRHLSVIGGTRVEDATNPMGPAMLAQAFRQAMGDLNVNMQVKLSIYKLFDRYVMATLEELYQEVNAALMQASVLPQLRHETVRGSGGAAGAATGESTAPLPTDDSEATAELLETLRSLFSARRARLNAPSARMSMGSAFTANEWLGTLSVLQSQAATVPVPPPTASIDTASLLDEVRQLKERLLTELNSLRGQRPGQIATLDEDTIDLVGLLFEFILQDRNLPAPMQVLLARLHIPYLKAAILDRKLFAHRQHSARRLLDGLAEAAKTWSEVSDQDGHLYDTVKAIVERLIQEFNDDILIFERLHAEWQQFQETNQRRAQLAEQRMAESTHGREKLEQARRHAAREIFKRVGENALPPLMRDVLSRAWTNYLVLTLLRKGEESNEWREALRFVDAFIASAKPVRTPEAKRSLDQRLPGIERALRKGLADMAFQANDIEELLARLNRYYRQQLGEAALTPPPAGESAPALLMPNSIPPIAESAAELDALTTEPTQDSLAPDVREQLAQVKLLQPGAWLAFVDLGKSKHGERAKLSWISPMSGRYLFVNRRGLKVNDFSPYALAAAMAEGRAWILTSHALCDRALKAIVDRLSCEAPHPGKTP